MANMVLIEAKTVGAGGSATIDFTAIPQTYTDLVIKISSRSNNASTFAHYVRFNSDSSANYSWRNLYGYNGAGYSDYDSAATYAWAGYSNNSSLTASTFSSTDIYIPNYAGSTHKTISSDAAMETNAANGVSIGLGGAFWKSTAAINSITILPSVGSYVEHTTAYLYGISKVTSTTKATGGIVSFDGTYNYHMFPYSGTFTPTVAITADVLVIAGGGGGGNSGGGAGGLLGFNSQSLSATNYAVVVGAGGTPGGYNGAWYDGTNGSDSQFGALTASVGGGRGRRQDAVYNGGNGGSGGGGAYGGTGGTAVSGQGYPGGGSTQSGQRGCGGGGGAGAAGEAGNSTTGGNGGNGLSTYAAWGYATQTGQIVAGSCYYAGGGGGGSFGSSAGAGAVGEGGYGGGGNAFTSYTLQDGNGEPGLPNTGGGGGGGKSDGTVPTHSGGNGGSGLVIIRYAI